jgi:hypothetical protein
MSEQSVIVWDLETVPDLAAAARMLDMGNASENGKPATTEHRIMGKLREIIRDERRRRQGLARGPRIVMWVTWEPILSPTGDRIVGKRQTGARPEIVGDPHRRIWEQHD